jgi:DNA-directed RNA polymerase sigma subunit (sigma70/sigma32)
MFELVVLGTTAGKILQAGREGHVDLASRLHAPEAADAAYSDAELISLVQSLPHGDARREQACEVLIARHQPMLRACAQRYRSSPEMTEELMQAGYIGLMKAINGFDPQVGNSLPAYAWATCSATRTRSCSTPSILMRCWLTGESWMTKASCCSPCGSTAT